MPPRWWVRLRWLLAPRTIGVDELGVLEDGSLGPPAHLLAQLDEAIATQLADPELIARVSSVLFALDPGLMAERRQLWNTRAYDPIAGTIIPRLGHVTDDRDAQRVVVEELERWDLTAGDQAVVRRASRKVLALVIERRESMAVDILNPDD